MPTHFHERDTTGFDQSPDHALIHSENLRCLINCQKPVGAWMPCRTSHLNLPAELIGRVA